jgi:hypothetical protein
MLKPDGDAVSFYIIYSASVAKSLALQQLAIDLIKFNIAIAIVAEEWFTTQHTDLLVNID